MADVTETATLPPGEEPFAPFRKYILPWLVSFIIASVPAGMLHVSERAPYWSEEFLSERDAAGLPFIGMPLFLLAILCFLGSFSLLLLLSVLVAFKRKSRELRRATACVLFFCFGTVTSLLLVYTSRMDYVATFTPVAERGQAIIDAVEIYRIAYGVYPKSVEDIVPAFLKEMPKTGLAGYPDFNYRIGDAQIPYEVWVDTPRGAMNWDRFIYWPTGDYDKHYWGGWVEPVGKWVYFHE